MVADRITVTSRRAGGDETWTWTSTGGAGFEVALADVSVGVDQDAREALAAVLGHLATSGDRIGAERLHQMGIVNRTTEPGHALAEALVQVWNELGLPLGAKAIAAE